MAGGLKQFLEGCVAVADGLEKTSEAMNRLRRGRSGGQVESRGQVIDVQSSQLSPTPREGAPASEMTVTHRDVKNIEERVAYIVGMIRKGRDSAEVRKFAVEAISKRCGDRWCTPEGDGEAEVRAVYARCQEVYRYCSDTFGKDLFQHPERTLEFGGGDCDDATILICAALGSVGFQTKCRVIRTKNADDWNHIYALVGLPQKSPSKWVALDLSVSSKPPGWQPPQNMIAQVKDFDVPL